MNGNNASTLAPLVKEIIKAIEDKVNELEHELGDPLIYLDGDNFDKILSRYKVVVVEFSAPWCNPCKAFTPVFKRVARKLSDPEKGIIFAYLDTDKASQIADRYNIENIPTTIIFVNGHIADVIIGATQEAKLEERVKNIIKEIER